MELPSDPSLRSIVKTFAHLRASHGAAIGAPPLVQPTAEYFPDEFRADGPSVAGLLRRMMGYAPLSSELSVELSIVMRDPDAMGGCGSGPCGMAPGSAHQAIIQLAVQVEDAPRDGAGVLVGGSKQRRDDGSLAPPRCLERQVIIHPSEHAA